MKRIRGCEADFILVDINKILQDRLSFWSFIISSMNIWSNNNSVKNNTVIKFNTIMPPNEVAVLCRRVSTSTWGFQASIFLVYNCQTFTKRGQTIGNFIALKFESTSVKILLLILLNQIALSVNFVAQWVLSEDKNGALTARIYGLFARLALFSRIIALTRKRIGKN